jgi:hypothetical protein
VSETSRKEEKLRQYQGSNATGSETCHLQQNVQFGIGAFSPCFQIRQRLLHPSNVESPIESLVFIEYLICVLEDRVNHSDLPARIRDIGSSVLSHERWSTQMT